MELMGRFPKKMSQRGAKGRKYVSKEGALNRIPKLQNWSLKDVMIAKYRYREDQAQFFQDFMYPMLNCYPERRCLSQQLLRHAWLRVPFPEDYLLYILFYSVTMKLIRRSGWRSTTSAKRRKRATSTSLSGKTQVLRTTRTRKSRICTRWRRWGISDK